MVYETQQFIRAYLDHGNAARAAREAKLGTGTAAARKGYRLLQKTHIRARLEELQADAVIRADQQAKDDERVAALTREVELDSVERLELTALIDLQKAEDRELKLIKRLRRAVTLGGVLRYRKGTRGGSQSRLARVCRQYRGEQARPPRAGALLLRPARHFANTT